MLGQTLLLLIGLVAILIAAECFTNGIETLGRKFSLSQVVVGSIFAAVGTALPETILPIVAIFFYGGASAREIGVGTIIGAPFMLSTLAFFLVGLTTLLAYARKRRAFVIAIEAHSTKRDLVFFLPMYSAAILIPIVAGKGLSSVIAVLLIAGYVFYAYLTFRCESADVELSEGMYLWKLASALKLRTEKTPHFMLILLQVAGALSLMVVGAYTFVKSLGRISAALGMNPLLFALILAPLATELPEKFNSITWTWKGKDTLAIGNITGAMVFQSAFPVSVGLLFTNWELTGLALFSAILALTSALIVLGEITFKKRISPITLLLCGGFYLMYVIALIVTAA